jgi:phosphatidylglycerol---prolipoprotein diacylglyceryl transferase
MLTISIDPVAFTIGSLTVRWYGIMVALAVILLIVVIPREAKRLGITRDLYSLFIWCIIGGFVGSRLTFVIGDWDYFVSDPRSILGFGGQAQNGMMIGVIAAALIYMAATKLRFSTLLNIGDAVAVATPLALAVGRIGCTLNGCCFGRLSPFESFPGAVIYALRPPDTLVRDWYQLPAQYTGVPLYPTQIYHVLWNLITFAIVWRFREKFKPPGSLFFFFLCLYAAGDFGLRFLRVGETVLPGLQQAQVLNLAILAIFLPWLIIKMRRFQPSAPAEPQTENL